MKNYGMTGLNAAKSGASISDCRGENTYATSSDTDYAFVILHGGVNDA